MIGSVPPILIWVPVITVGRIIIIAIVIIRSLVSRANVNAEAFIGFGSGGCQHNEPECCQSQEKNSLIPVTTQVLVR